MRRDLKCLAPHVNLLININKRIDEEDPRTPCPTSEQPTKPEYHRPLIFLHRTTLVFYFIIIISFTCTTFTTQNRDKGREATIRNKEPIVRIREQMLGPSSQARK